MSFSSIVKEEVCRLEIKDFCCAKSELSGALISEVDKYSNSMLIMSENSSVARRFFKLMKHLRCSDVSIFKQRKVNSLKSNFYHIKCSNIPDGINTIDFSKSNYCCIKSFIRGSFLAVGSIINPEKSYHLELAFRSGLVANDFCEILRNFDLNSKVVKRKDNYVVYLKEAENVADFLKILGASVSLMEMENLRIIKNVRNDVNRKLNCESANLDKSINASLKQLNDIELINNKIGLSNLPDNLRIIAELRQNNHDLNLKELGQLTEPPIGKSGVNHRMKKIHEIAADLRNLEGEK